MQNNITPQVKDIKTTLSSQEKNLFDTQTIAAQKRQEYDAMSIKNRIQNKSALHDIWLRFITCICACFLLLGWLTFVGTLLWEVAGNSKVILSDEVLMALLTATTVKVIALYRIVLKGLFLK